MALEAAAYRAVISAISPPALPEVEVSNSFADQTKPLPDIVLIKGSYAFE